jgi:hypothetical protein
MFCFIEFEKETLIVIKDELRIKETDRSTQYLISVFDRRIEDLKKMENIIVER